MANVSKRSLITGVLGIVLFLLAIWIGSLGIQLAMRIVGMVLIVVSIYFQVKDKSSV